jgi:hypothetical protein
MTTQPASLMEQFARVIGPARVLTDTQGADEPRQDLPRLRHHADLRPAAEFQRISSPTPEGVLTVDQLTFVLDCK